MQRAANTSTSKWSVSVYMMIVVVAAGCGLAEAPVATPTLIPSTATVTRTATLPATVTLSPEPGTVTPEALVEPSDTPLPPSNTPFPTSTPGPFEHTIQSEETLGYIIQLYGHDFSFDAIDAVVAINENVLNRDTLPSAGEVILVPRPTIPVVTEEVGGGDAEGTDDSDVVTVAESAPPSQLTGPTNIHVVVEGQTIIDVAQIHNTTLEVLSQLNAELNFFGCNFNNPSGGPNCSVPLQVGQELVVPAPTPTPTLSPTPSGNETPTPTPTYISPIAVFPPNGGIAQPGRIALQWVSVGILEPDEAYVVQVKDLTAGTDVVAFVTRSNSYDLPTDLIPRDGQQHQFQWWVSVGKQNSQGLYDVISGGAPINTFEWQSAESSG